MSDVPRDSKPDASLPEEEGQRMLPRTSLPFVEGERRQNDRRQNDRQGKYDRRRNRCQHCAHFRENGADPEQGFCQFHAILMSPDAFACPHFESDQASL